MLSNRTATHKEPPTLRMDAQPVPGATQSDGDCPQLKDLKRVFGPVPRDAVVVIEMTIKGDVPVPLAYYEEALAQRAEQWCCDGMSVLRAEAEPGAELFTEVKAKGWRLPPPDVE
jgi:hypothetical protein